MFFLALVAGFWAVVFFMNFLESHDWWALFGFLDSIFILYVLGCSEERVRKEVLWTLASLKFLICKPLAFVSLWSASFFPLVSLHSLFFSKEKESEYPK